MDLRSPAWDAGFFAHARERHLDSFPSADGAVTEAVDAFLTIDAPANAAALADVDPAWVQRAAVAARQAA